MVDLRNNHVKIIDSGRDPERGYINVREKLENSTFMSNNTSTRSSFSYPEETVFLTCSVFGI